jgi:hypothetical protein
MPKVKMTGPVQRSTQAQQRPEVKGELLTEACEAVASNARSGICSFPSAQHPTDRYECNANTGNDERYEAVATLRRNTSEVLTVSRNSMNPGPKFKRQKSAAPDNSNAPTSASTQPAHMKKVLIEGCSRFLQSFSGASGATGTLPKVYRKMCGITWRPRHPCRLPLHRRYVGPRDFYFSALTYRP